MLLIACCSLHAQVSDSVMQHIYEEIRTPYKFGMVIVPENDSKKIDCPTVFKKGKKWYMSYLQFDGRGYETWLAVSDDLLHWTTKGKMMSFSSDTTLWDANQKAGYMALVDPAWEGSYAASKFKGKYWMSYFGGNTKGYEAGDLAIGIASSKRSPAVVNEWKRTAAPVVSSFNKDVRWWENKKQFKSTVIWDKQRSTGFSFVMYYNANGDTVLNNKKTRWFERIGMAGSDDMLHWKRIGIEPVVHHPVGITGDPVLQKIGDVWVMFYFGAFWQDRKGAFNRFACSYDLLHWTDWNGASLIESSEKFDEKYAHKSSVVKYKGVVYHFYCAVNNKDQRGIAVATSRDLGKSEVEFVNEKNK